MDAIDPEPREKATRRVHLRYFAIALVPIAFFVMNGVITDNFIAEDLDVPPGILKEGQHWLEAAGRYRFLTATWLFGSFTLLAVALLCRNLTRPIAPQTRIAALATLGVILLLAVLPTLAHMLSPDHDAQGPGVYRHIGVALFEEVLSRGRLPGCLEPDDVWLMGRCGDNPVVTMFDRVMDLINIFAGLGVGALIVGTILCLEVRDNDTVEEQAALLVENLQHLRHQLYLSSLILTFGMFFATSWMYWPLELVVDAEQPAYRSVLLGAALFTGTYFSLLILSFYLPVALILDARMRALATSALKTPQTKIPEDVQTWRAAHGLKDGVSDQVRAALALLAPILAAFAGGLSPINL